MRYSEQTLVSVILPCYNPEAGWCEILQKNIVELREKMPGVAWQFIVSNDGSTRLDRARVCHIQTIPGVIFLDHVVNEGKGSAIRKGALRADGEMIIYTDIDFPFGTDPVCEMVEMFRQHPCCWFIYGNRGNTYFKRLPFKRRVVSRALHMINRLVLSGDIVDTQAGMKGFRREVLPVLQMTRTNSFVFEVELIRKLLRKGVAIRKVDVSAKPSIVFSDFGVKVLVREALSFGRILIMSSLWNDLS